ncbi:MAG: DbpA RNA binding domain-containing protein [Clostridia bacterium]|nr:DbpA RNA binding domain-containing protein [Clostridia bacterium]
MDEQEFLKKRFAELYRKATERGIYTYTDFLGLAEQSVFAEIKNSLSPTAYTLFGGVEGAERVIIRFGEDGSFGSDFPIVCVKAEPVSQKFADKLTHRDFLGALLNLGIERSTLGDIAIIDNVGYIFVKKDVAPHVMSELGRVKRTDVILSEADAPEARELYRTERRRVQAVGERIDAIVAKLFSLSREEASTLFTKRLVFVGGRLCENNSYQLKEGEVVSVRGHGRFIYRGYETKSKKGKLNIEVDVYV